MQNTISAEQLFLTHESRLDLCWLAGQSGKDRIIDLGDEDMNASLDELSLAGHLNFIHLHQVQVLGRQELDYLASISETQRREMLIKLFDSKPLCMIIARELQAPDELIELANNSSTPLFASTQNSQLIVNHLQYFLSHKLAKRITIHGVFMDVMGIGVLLTGSSGIGKSELALELLSRGHRLIADDSPEFFLAEPEIISGGCPPALQDFLEVRGLGILNIRTMFGDSAMRETKYLRLIIHLQSFTDDELQNIDRLRGSHQRKTILDVHIPQITIPVAPGRNMAVIVEVAIRNHILAMKGYNAAEDFILKQQQFIN